MPEIKASSLESLIGLIVHDLRNPAATLGANIGFLREVLGDPSVPVEEMRDALGDAQQALADMMRGLDQVAWMGRWFNEHTALPAKVEDLRHTLERVKRRVVHGDLQVELPDGEVLVRGGDALERLVEVLVSNGHQHAQGKSVDVRVREDVSHVVLEIEDQGRPLASEFRNSAFTLDGQFDLKGRADGRYGRVAGLFAAGILAASLDARLEADEQSGRNVFRVTLSRA